MCRSPSSWWDPWLLPKGSGTGMDSFFWTNESSSSWRTSVMGKWSLQGLDGTTLHPADDFSGTSSWAIGHHRASPPSDQTSQRPEQQTLWGRIQHRPLSYRTIGQWTKTRPWDSNGLALPPSIFYLKMNQMMAWILSLERSWMDLTSQSLLLPPHLHLYQNLQYHLQIKMQHLHFHFMIHYHKEINLHRNLTFHLTTSPLKRNCINWHQSSDHSLTRTSRQNELESTNRRRWATSHLLIKQHPTPHMHLKDDMILHIQLIQQLHLTATNLWMMLLSFTTSRLTWTVRILNFLLDGISRMAMWWWVTSPMNGRSKATTWSVSTMFPETVPLIPWKSNAPFLWNTSWRRTTWNTCWSCALWGSTSCWKAWREWRTWRPEPHHDDVVTNLENLVAHLREQLRLANEDNLHHYNHLQELLQEHERLVEQHGAAQRVAGDYTTWTVSWHFNKLRCKEISRRTSRSRFKWLWIKGLTSCWIAMCT